MMAPYESGRLLEVLETTTLHLFPWLFHVFKYFTTLDVNWMMSSDNNNNNNNL